MKCDELTIAAFIAGELTAQDAERFDTHLLGCDPCWEAIQQARRGRALAVGLNAPAPPALAERVRAAISEQPEPARRSTRRGVLVAGAGAIAAAIFAASLILTSHGGHRGDPAVIAALVSVAESRGPAAPVAPSPPGARPYRQRVLSQVAVSRRLIDGQVVIVARSREPFPMPAGAHPAFAGTTQPWVVSRGSLTLVCFNGIHPTLLVGPVPVAGLVALAQAIGLGN